MNNLNLKHELPHVQMHLGEGVQWHPYEQALYWVDILEARIHRWQPESNAHSIIQLFEHIGCFAFRKKGGFIAALRSGIYVLDAQGHIQRKLLDNPTGAAHSRFNDGKADAWGRFWAGTIWEPRDCNGAELWRLDVNGQAQRMQDDILVSNGLAFAPSGRLAMHSDTPNRVLYAYDLDENGQVLGQRRVVRHFDPEGGRPDGGCFDAQGYYWSALFDGGRVVQIDPATGKILRQIAVPTRWPTMVAFGGVDLQTLYITSSRENRSAAELEQYPLSGGLFSVALDVCGHSTDFCAL